MKCAISGFNIRGSTWFHQNASKFDLIPFLSRTKFSVFYRALQFLARIGDEIHFESFASGLCMSTVNSRKTAYGSIKFEVEFFSDYEDDLGKDDETQCKVSIKAILPLFRSLKQVRKKFILKVVWLFFSVLLLDWTWLNSTGSKELQTCFQVFVSTKGQQNTFSSYFGFFATWWTCYSRDIQQ